MGTRRNTIPIQAPFKGQGHSKMLTFLSPPIASKLWVFPPLQRLLSRRISSREKPKKSTLEAAILKLTWQPGRVFGALFRPTRNSWEAKRPATDLASFTS